MSTPNEPQDPGPGADEHNSAASREDEIRKWQAQQRKPGIAKGAVKNGGIGGFVVIGIAVAVLGAWWYFSHKGGDSSGVGTDSGFSLAPPPILKPLHSDIEPASAPAASAPQVASAPVQVVPAPAGQPRAVTDADLMRQQEAQRRLQEKQKEQAMLEARLKSALLAQTPTTEAGTAGAAVAASGSILGGTPSASGSSDPNLRFESEVTGHGVPEVKASLMTGLDYKILQDTIIDCIEVEPMDSDLPGSVTCMLTHDVYSAAGTIVLLPAGTLVHGTYNTTIAQAQDRMFVVWQRAVTPEPHVVQVQLDSSGADQLGMAGIPGDVNSHFFKIFGTAAAISLIGAGAQTAGVSSGDQYNSASAYRSAIGTAAGNSANTVLSQQLNIKPTITTPQARRVQILINRDLDFSDVYARTSTNAETRAGVTFIN